MQVDAHENLERREVSHWGAGEVERLKRGETLEGRKVSHLRLVEVERPKLRETLEGRKVGHRVRRRLSD